MDVEDVAHFQCRFQFADFVLSWLDNFFFICNVGVGVGCILGTRWFGTPSFSVPYCNGREDRYRSHAVGQRLMLFDSLGVCVCVCSLNVASGAHARAGPCPISIATMMAFVETQCPLMAARVWWSWSFVAIAGQVWFAHSCSSCAWRATSRFGIHSCLSTILVLWASVGGGVLFRFGPCGRDSWTAHRSASLDTKGK